MALKKRIGMAGALWLAACSPEPGLLSSAQLLTRASIDLRGVRPTPAEIAEVEADPSKVDDFIDDYLQDPRFGERIISTFGDIYRTRLDEFSIQASDFNIENEQAFVNSMGEESLRRLAHVALNDLPYGTIVTADFTLADENLAQVLPVDYPAGATGWQVVKYNDGRPTAGLLSDSSFWLRYGSTFVNSNRGRANAVSRILLGQDYLSQPIRFERINLIDGDAIRDAIRNNGGCKSCHSSLDPLAANFWGFFYDNPESTLETTFYHPEKEFFWEFTNETEPGYYGTPTPTLQALGQTIAQDPQFIESVTKQVYEILLARSATFEDTESLSEHREAFVDSGTKLRALYRSILRSPEYRTDGVDDPRFTTLKAVNVDIIASQIKELTGFDGLTPEGVDLYRRSNEGGLRTLLGGADGFFVTTPSKEPTVTQSLVMERIAETAAATVVNSDFDIADPAARRLFKDIDFSQTITNPDALRVQMQALRLQVLGQRAELTSAEITDDLQLWSELFAVDGTNTKLAWSGVLAALLRDPAFMLY
jgi:hypothetical protein